MCPQTLRMPEGGCRKCQLLYRQEAFCFRKDLEHLPLINASSFQCVASACAGIDLRLFAMEAFVPLDLYVGHIRL